MLILLYKLLLYVLYIQYWHPYRKMSVYVLEPNTVERYLLTHFFHENTTDNIIIRVRIAMEVVEVEFFLKCL